MLDDTRIRIRTSYLTDPDPGGPKHTDPIDPDRIRNTAISITYPYLLVWVKTTALPGGSEASPSLHSQRQPSSASYPSKKILLIIS